MIVQSPRKEIGSNSVCSGVAIDINGVRLLANLILLDSSGIDVILGMD